MNVIDLLPVCMSLFLVCADEHIPDGRYLTVHVHCGNKSMGGSVDLHSDLIITATATCKSEHRATLTRLDNTTYTLPVIYGGHSGHACVFIKKQEEHAVQIGVEWREFAAAPVNEEIYHITCIYNGTAIVGKVDHPILKTIIYPKIIEVYQGKQSQRNFSLLLVDVLNRKLEGVDVRTGKKVKLKAYVGPAVSTSEQGSTLGNFQTFQLGLSTGTIYPVSCDAIGATYGKRYAILRAGCGDGIVLRHDIGFSIKQNMAESPYFKYFHLAGDDKLKFECNFTICENCVNENSCSNKPKPSLTLDELWSQFVDWLAKNKPSAVGKRSVPDLNDIVSVNSNVIKVQQTKYNTRHGIIVLTNDTVEERDSPVQIPIRNTYLDHRNSQKTDDVSKLKSVIAWPQKVVICTMGAIIGSIMVIIVICVCHERRMCTRQSVQNVRLTNGPI